MKILNTCAAAAMIAAISAMAAFAQAPQALNARTGPDWVGVEERVEASFACSDVAEVGTEAPKGRYAYVRGDFSSPKTIERSDRLVELRFGSHVASQALLERASKEWQVRGFAQIISIDPLCSADGRKVRMSIRYWRAALESGADNGHRAVIVLLDDQGGEFVNGEAISTP